MQIKDLASVITLDDKDVLVLDNKDGQTRKITVEDLCKQIIDKIASESTAVTTEKQSVADSKALSSLSSKVGNISSHTEVITNPIVLGTTYNGTMQMLGVKYTIPWEDTYYIIAKMTTTNIGGLFKFVSTENYDGQLFVFTRFRGVDSSLGWRPLSNEIGITRQMTTNISGANAYRCGNTATIYVHYTCSVRGSWQTVGTLPSNLRPITSVYTLAHASNGVYAAFLINTDGTLKALTHTTGDIDMWGTITYLTTW